MADKAGASTATHITRTARTTDFKRAFPPRSLYFLTNAGRGTSERGTRYGRTWDETQSNAGRRSLKSIGTLAKRCGKGGSDMGSAAKRLLFARPGRHRLHGGVRSHEADDAARKPSILKHTSHWGLFPCCIPPRAESEFNVFLPTHRESDLNVCADANEHRKAWETRHYSSLRFPGF